MLHHKLYVLPFVFAALLFLLPLHGLAATVEYSSGTHHYLIGNPVTAGDSAGMGGQDDYSVFVNNANASGNTVTVTGGMVNLIISGGCYIDTYHTDVVANDNRVDITNFTGGKNTQVYGGYAVTEGRASGITAITMRNNVTVRGGEVLRHLRRLCFHHPLRLCFPPLRLCPVWRQQGACYRRHCGFH